MNESYEIIKRLAGELHDLQSKYEQSESDRERYLNWWLEEQDKRKKLEENRAAVEARHENNQGKALL